MVLIFAVFLCVGFLYLGIQGFKTGTLGRSLPPLLIVAAGIDLIFILIWSNRRHYLSLDTRLESPSFFAKNREEFGKQAVTATISGLVGGLIGYLFGHYLK